MKVVRISFSLLLLFFLSCSTDFDINGTWKDITVVYGIVNQNDTVTYIKINKAFLGDDALMIAQIRDSNEYNVKLEVRIEEWSNNYLVRNFIFDTTTIGNKEPGDFYSPSQTLYKAATPNLNPENTYKLSIRNPATEKILYSQTILCSSFDVEKPSASQKLIAFSTEGSVKVIWKSGKNGRRYQLMIRFNYKEVPVSGGDTTYHSVDWLFPTYKASSLNGGEEMTLYYSNPMFYDMLRSQIPVDPNVKRYIGLKGHSEFDFGAVQFIFSVAADEFSTYLDVYEPSTGVVQEKPDYTNIQGDDALGIFSSRYQVFRTFKIEDVTKGRIKSMGLGF